MRIILKSKLKNITKEGLKILIILLSLIYVVLVIFTVKYKKMYKVYIAGEEVGYIRNIEELQNKINIDMYNDEESKYMAFYTLNEEPEYEKVFTSKDTKQNIDEILNKVKENTTPTYMVYEIIENGETKSYVSSMEEAEEVVGKLKKQIDSEELEITLEVEKKYTEDLASLEISNKEKVEEELNEDIEKAIKIKGSTVNGVVLATTPVKGTYISSRYGDSYGRTGGHCGLDIAAPMGTTIVASGDGTVKLASESYYGYGKLVIIDHGNGVETYYAHCSKLCVTQGQKITAGDKIAEVGATGEATGPHLHLEVRVNGRIVNPQLYLYK